MDKKREFDNLVRVFSDSTVNVMEQLLDDSTLKVSFNPKKIDGIECRSQIAFDAGDFKGALYLSMSSKTYFNIFKKVVGESAPADNEFINEMANMIYGNSKAVLEKMDYHFDMAFPHTFNEVPSGDLQVVAYESTYGKFYIKVGL